MQNRQATICKQQQWRIKTGCTLGDLAGEREKLDNPTETKPHSHHNYAVNIQLAQARPHNTLYLD